MTIAVSGGGGHGRQMCRLLVMVAAFACLATASAAKDATTCQPKPGERHTVVRVLDAVTVLLDDGTEARIAGIIAPEPPLPDDPSTLGAAWPYLAAAEKALAVLATGQTVALPKGARKHDRYGRLRSDLLIGEGNAAHSVAVALVEAGMARVFPLSDDRVCISVLLSAEATARKTKLGLWQAAAYAIRSPEKPKDLARYRDQFVIVEGTVSEAAEAGGRLFLNFGPLWRQDFTAVVEKRNRKAFEQAGFDFKAMTGAIVQVRGYLGYAYGPALSLEIPGLLQILKAAPEKPADEIALDPGR